MSQKTHYVFIEFSLSLSALLFVPWDDVNHARHQMKSKREKESNLRSTRVARNFTHVVFRCLFAPASSFRTNSFLVTYLLCGREFWFPTRQNLTESGSVIAALRAARGKLTCAAFFRSYSSPIKDQPHAVQRFLIQRTADVRAFVENLMHRRFYGIRSYEIYW